MSNNPTLDLANQFARYTHKNIFLTGKAGTGKTTFLRNLKSSVHKRMAVVAPTGVAAINAGGVTIHSFFQLPFTPHIPDSIISTGGNHRFTKERINLIKSLDMLVIDEISMVRADLLDAIDEVLRKYRNRSKPFGGVQLLMIGDLHQLAPVVKEEDWRLLKDYYDTAYFFGSRALELTNPVRIELTHIYRQTDNVFIDLLNNIRENQITPSVLEALNQRYVPNFKPSEEDGYITLTTHNKSALTINVEKLAGIKANKRSYAAEITGDFPPYSYPTEQLLELKVGAQVMFVKNDPSREKLFYNGKIGQVLRVSDGRITVKCKDDSLEIEVEPVEWRNVKYVLNEQTKEIDEQLIGSFTQFPLKLAWAITIHKSQGLTFEKAIIDANLSFAHGQVYVALSRCKSFEGMVLSSRIGSSSVKTDATVSSYTTETSKNQPSLEQLLVEKHKFQQELLFELFDLGLLKRAMYQLQKVITENAVLLNAGAMDSFRGLLELMHNQLYVVADKFKVQLERMLLQENITVESDEIQERVKKGSTYFFEKLEHSIKPMIEGLEIETDNKAIKKSVSQFSEQLKKEIFIKIKCMSESATAFSAQDYLRTKANADIDFVTKTAAAVPVQSVSVPKSVAHPKLYAELKAWRNGVAAENDVLDYMVLSVKTINELVKELPLTLGHLGKIKGIGKVKLREYGSTILEMIETYCTENDIVPETQPQAMKSEIVKAEKVNTKEVSLKMFQEGKTVFEIAQARGLTTGTIENHLLNYIATGEVSVYALFAAEKIDPILDYIRENIGKTSTEVRGVLGEVYSYSEIRAASKHLLSISE